MSQQRKRQKGRAVDGTEGLLMLHGNAAGIDVGNAEHYVAVPPPGCSTGAEVW